MIVTVSGLSGDRNAYRSVLSAVGSSEINGASRWLDAIPALGLGPVTAAMPTATVSAPRKAAASRSVRFIPTSPFERRALGDDAAGSHRPAKRFGPRSHLNRAA